MPKVAMVGPKERGSERARAASPKTHRCDVLPREHGFWVMLLSALGSALWRTGAGAEPLLLAAVAAVAAIGIGGRLAKYLRRHAAAQLAVSFGFGVMGLPIELFSGIAAEEAIGRALCLGVVFLASALAVRASFERDGPRRSSLEVASVVVPLASSALLGVRAPRAALAALAAAIVTGLLDAHRPSTKDLRRVGLLLAALAALVVVVLNFRTTPG